MITNPNSPSDITPAVLAALDAGVSSLREGCASLPTADAALLRRVAKMGLKSETFSREAIELAKQNPDLCPAGIDLDRAADVIAVRDQLMSRYQQAQQLAEQLRVALQVCGVDAFDVARTAYKSMKANCRDAALLEIIDHLGRNFRGRRSGKNVAEETGDSTNKQPDPNPNGTATTDCKPGAGVSAGQMKPIPERAVQKSAAPRPDTDARPSVAVMRVMHRIGHPAQASLARHRIYWQSGMSRPINLGTRQPGRNG